MIWILVLLGAVSARLGFTYGVDNIPHPSKVKKGGEDAWLAQRDLIVVADGVSAWVKVGVDSGLFSKRLVSDIYLNHQRYKSRELKYIIRDSTNENVYPGSSTLVLAKLVDDHLHSAIVGDSAYILYRPSPLGTLNKLYRSPD